MHCEHEPLSCAFCVFVYLSLEGRHSGSGIFAVGALRPLNPNATLSPSPNHSIIVQVSVQVQVFRFKFKFMR